MAKSKYAEFFNIFKNASTNEGVTTTTTTYICKELDCSFKWVQKPGGPTNTLRTHLQGKHPDTFKVLEARDLVAKTAKGETAASKPAKSKEPKPKSAKANTSATSVKKETTLDNSAIDNNNLTENIQTQMEAILASSDGAAFEQSSNEGLASAISTLCPLLTTVATQAKSPHAMSRKRNAEDDIDEWIDARASPGPWSMQRPPATAAIVFSRLVGERLNMMTKKKRKGLESNILKLINDAESDDEIAAVVDETLPLDSALAIENAQDAANVDGNSESGGSTANEEAPADESPIQGDEEQNVETTVEVTTEAQ